MPALDVPHLKERIGRRVLAPVHLFVGEDVRLIDRFVDDVEATIDEADRAFAVERIHAGEPGGLPIDIAAAARVFPMLGDRRIVIVLRAERFLKFRAGAKTVDLVMIEWLHRTLFIEVWPDFAGVLRGPAPPYLHRNSHSATDAERKPTGCRRPVETCLVWVGHGPRLGLPGRVSSNPP